MVQRSQPAPARHRHGDDVRLFGKPESFARRRMGVALANGKDVDEARERAKLAAGKVRPVKA